MRTPVGRARREQAAVTWSIGPLCESSHSLRQSEMAVASAVGVGVPDTTRGVRSVPARADGTEWSENRTEGIKDYRAQRPSDALGPQSILSANRADGEMNPQCVVLALIHFGIGLAKMAAI